MLMLAIGQRADIGSFPGNGMSASQWWKGATGPQDYGRQDDGTKRCAAVKAAELQRIRSGVCEFTARFGNRAAEFARGFNPFVDDLFCVFYGFGVGLAVRSEERRVGKEW